jgi:hypothetical protein
MAGAQQNTGPSCSRAHLDPTPVCSGCNPHKGFVRYRIAQLTAGTHLADALLIQETYAPAAAALALLLCSNKALRASLAPCRRRVRHGVSSYKGRSAVPA